MPHTRVELLALCACLAPAAAVAGGSQEHAHSLRPGQELVYGCWADEHGHLSGGRFVVDTGMANIEDAAAVAGLRARGFGDNRVDLILMGDGYTEAEMARFHLDADRIAVEFFAYEPFIRYRPYFRITKIEVVSAESGVDNDPVQGIERDTALNMGFWCGGTERALCVSTSRAYAHAWTIAPDIDQILTIANSSKYGGVGYPSSNVGTVSGQNSLAVQVAIHEMGHSLGNLADEYSYDGPANYTGPEPTTANLTTLTPGEMETLETKWFRWLGEIEPGFDSPVWAFEGGGYSQHGIYRPSIDSMMRSLSRNFNLPSAEKLIKEFYREVSPIDSAAPSGTVFTPSDVVTVTPMRPVGTPLEIEWRLDGVAVASGVESLDLADLDIGLGSHELELRVWDPTEWVRNPFVISDFLTDTRVYTVESCGASADVNNDGVLDLADITLFVTAFLGMDPSADLAEPIGVFDLADLVQYVTAFGDGCM